MNKPKNLESSWERPAVTFRLSENRRRDLMSLAEGLPGRPSPTSALDHAIAMALASRSSQAVAEFDELGEGLRLLTAQAKGAADQHGKAIADLAKNVKELRDVILAVAAGSGQDGSDFGEGVLSMRDWLDAEAKLAQSQSFLAKARWQSKSRLDELSFSLDLLVERIATTNLQGHAARGIPAIVRLEPIGVGNPMEQVASMPSVYMMCIADSFSKWRVDLHAIDPNSKPENTFGCIRL